MKKFTYLLFLAMGITSCSVESVDSTENLLTADMKVKMQQIDKSMHLELEEICEGDAPVFVFNFPQDYAGQSGTKDTDISIQLLDTISGEWGYFDDVTYPGSGPQKYSYTGEVLEIGSYYFRTKIGSGGYTYEATLKVVDCSECEESFSYNLNENGTYTFTYIPAEDMSAANVVFTFAQGVKVSGLDGWVSNGQTMQSEMVFDACEVYSWTVGLDVVCGGVGQPNANLWTDFKVDGNSKKGELENIVKSCK